MTVSLLAQLLAAFANVYRDRKKHPREYEPADFLPRPPESTDMRAQGHRWNEALSEMRSAYATRKGGH